MSLKWLNKQTLEHNEKLFQHCNVCDGVQCTYPKCEHGIKYLDHFNECKFETEDCQICHSVFQVLMYHSSKCKNKNCDYPYCKLIKRKLSKEYQNKVKNKINIIKKEIQITEHVYNNFEESLENIKDNVRTIIDAYYPKAKVEII